MADQATKPGAVKPADDGLTDEQRIVRKAAADDAAAKAKQAADEEAAAKKREADEAAAVKARDGEDQKLLGDSGNWTAVKDRPGYWNNDKRFTCSDNGKTVSVPDGITRPTAEAARLERLRPKK